MSTHFINLHYLSGSYHIKVIPYDFENLPYFHSILYVSIYSSMLCQDALDYSGPSLLRNYIFFFSTRNHILYKLRAHQYFILGLYSQMWTSCTILYHMQLIWCPWDHLNFWILNTFTVKSFLISWSYLLFSILN